MKNAKQGTPPVSSRASENAKSSEVGRPTLSDGNPEAKDAEHPQPARSAPANSQVGTEGRSSRVSGEAHAGKGRVRGEIADQLRHSVPTDRQTVLSEADERQYGVVGEPLAELKRISVEVAALWENVVQTYIKLHARLSEARTLLAPGRTGAWREWIEHETPFSYKQVLRIINSSESVLPVIQQEFGGVVSNAWSQVSPTAFYELAKLNPKQIKEVIELAEAGVAIEPRTLRERFGHQVRQRSSSSCSKSATTDSSSVDSLPNGAAMCNPMAVVVRYLSELKLNCLVRGPEDPAEGPVALLIYSSKAVPAADWNGLGKVRPAEEFGASVVEQAN